MAVNKTIFYNIEYFCGGREFDIQYNKEVSSSGSILTFFVQNCQVCTNKFAKGHWKQSKPEILLASQSLTNNNASAFIISLILILPSLENELPHSEAASLHFVFQRKEISRRRVGQFLLGSIILLHLSSFVFVVFYNNWINQLWMNSLLKIFYWS